MRKIMFPLVAFALIATAALAPVRAKPAPVVMAPAPDTMAPSMAPVMASESAMVPAPAMAMEAVKAPTAEPAKASKPTPAWKTAEFWILRVVLPVLLFVLGLGILKKTWLQWLKEKGIIAVADKVVSGFEAYATGTKVKWDDALAQALKAVVARFGELTDAQEAKVKALVAERKEQAEKKNDNG